MSAMPRIAPSHAPHSARCPAHLSDWHRSSYSTGMNNCVETATIGPGFLAVRDAQRTRGPALLFTPAAWTRFVSGLNGGALLEL
ncbi:DUF397 domain-containing protein [Streptomyces sp. NPDC001262]|uniref:DUF397 domain-containing protein n=1 Tax=Streptomyces TaxID=1883 RepID=UPI0036817749